MKHIFFSILSTLVFCQCQESAPEPQKTLSCYVRFDAASGQIKAEATLRQGDKKQVVEMPGGIRFQSAEMNALPYQGITYSTEYAAAYTAETVFDWKNKKWEKVQFSLAMPSIDSFHFDSPVLSTQKSADFVWVGEPLSKGETLVFIWENAAEGKTLRMEVSTTLGAPLIEFPAAKLAQLGAGEWSLYVVRKRPSKAEAGGFFVESVAEFYTKAVSVKVEK